MIEQLRVAVGLCLLRLAYRIMPEGTVVYKVLRTSKKESSHEQ